MEENEQGADEPPVASYGLLYITRAYNRREITLDEWLRQSREWAEQIIRQHGKEVSYGRERTGRRPGAGGAGT